MTVWRTTIGHFSLFLNNPMHRQQSPFHTEAALVEETNGKEFKSRLNLIFDLQFHSVNAALTDTKICPDTIHSVRQVRCALLNVLRCLTAFFFCQPVRPRYWQSAAQVSPAAFYNTANWMELIWPRVTKDNDKVKFNGCVKIIWSKEEVSLTWQSTLFLSLS